MTLRILLVLLLVSLFVLVFVIPTAKGLVVSEDRNQTYFRGNHDVRTLPPNPQVMKIGARLDNRMDELQRISYGLE